MISKTQRINWAVKFVAETETLLAAVANIEELRKQWDAGGGGAVFQEGDFAPETDISHLTAGRLADALTSIDALRAVLAAGHYTNLYRIVR